MPVAAPVFRRPADTYWLTRFIILRWLGFVYFIAFYAAARQLVPLVGANGLTPAPLFAEAVREHFGSTHDAMIWMPSLFWLNSSDAWLQAVPWIGVVLSCVVLAGYANSLLLALLWMLYMSIVHIGQEWYGFAWETQLLETGFLAIFLCPLLDARPFPRLAPPVVVIFLFRWLIFRLMIGSALIKLRYDTCWTDLTALNFFFETQPIPNPLSRWFHFLPEMVLQSGVLATYLVELVAPWFVFGPRRVRLIAGCLLVGFQGALIVSGNFAFFNWLTIIPALACFDDRFWKRILPTSLASAAVEAQIAARPSRAANVVTWAVAGVVALLSINVVLNLFSRKQVMNASYDPLHLVQTYGAFGTVTRERYVIIFEGNDDDDPQSKKGWKEYPYAASPWDPKLAPVQVAPYQPHLDWQLWFAAMGEKDEYPWVYNLQWKLLHNDPATLSLFAGNPFPDHPPKVVRAVLYLYQFAPPENRQYGYWMRKWIRVWLPAATADNLELRAEIQSRRWMQ